MTLPQPYYEDDHATIYHADCLDVLPHLSGVGAVFTSPPYNKGNESKTKKEWQRLADGYADHSDDLPHGEYVAWQHKVVSACWNTLTDDGAIYYQHKVQAKGNEALIPFELIPDELPIRQIITWDRGSGFQRNCTHYVPRSEWIILIAKEPFRTNTRSVDDVWQVTPNADAGHPASFPIELPTIAINSIDHKLILDPFMGSGTTLRAAKNLGRKSIGIELSERYCEIAANRLAQEVLDFG